MAMAMGRWEWVLLLVAVVVLVAAADASSSSGLLRHSSHRHRREPVPMPLPQELPEDGLDFLPIHHRKAEQLQNKYKPEIIGCEDYKPEVLEESPRGTRVIQVYAKDRDAEESEGPNGQIIYSIVSQHNKFTIDPKSGLLSTSAIFNRDEPDRVKVVHVTVKASDQGRPQLEDVCTLAVRIKDKNDNEPIFDRAKYDVPMAQDTPVGTPIMRISATDVDEGENQQITYDLRAARVPEDLEYFQWHYKSGVVTLRKKIDKLVNYVFEFQATAKDSGNPSLSAEIPVTIEVKESDNKPPSFRNSHGRTISISEGYSEFSKPIASFQADSNIPGDPTVFFQLVRGRTEQTNKDDTFRAVQSIEEPDKVYIYLAKPLEFEKLSRYSLTLQVRNSPDLVEEALLTINVQDENNQAPVFTNVESGNVLEHEPAGTIVMQVSAIDNDGTSPNNKVTYAISKRNKPEIRNMFDINPETGIVTTKVEFDREEQAVYALTIEAFDGANSSVLKNGMPNSTPHTFRIAIVDKNDNAPYFPQQLYTAEVPEDQDVQSKVIEVRAEDLDEEASITTYQIISGNLGNAFLIEEQTGYIRVAKPLDYEMNRKYYLVVGAWDGEFTNQTQVEITILNVNDMKPEFRQDQYSVTQLEEAIPSFPIVQVSALDPDIGDPSVDQNITYYLDPESQTAKHFSIDQNTGDVRIIKKLDRDLPNGVPTVTVYIFAKDEGGGPTGIENYVELVVTLDDINDNAPFLDMPDGLVWRENQGPGDIGVLLANDYDTHEENGPPYTFRLDGTANQDIKQWFEVEQSHNGSYILRALVTFDREFRKTYDVPISICDRKNLCDVSILKLTIGDENDNPMEPGHSNIFVYNYEGKAPDTEIGRVYVTDPDDWDLPDKTFRFKDPNKYQGFALNRNNGMITMKRGIHLDQPVKSWLLQFYVEDPIHNQIGRAAVEATVNVTVQKIPREAVIQSGSLRIKGPPEDFIRPDSNDVTKREEFKHKMSKILNATFVDVFTVLPARNGEYTDIRFSAHGSPYLRPEKLEGLLARRREDLSTSLHIEIDMIHVDECLFEGVHCEGLSCINHLEIKEEPITVYTNTSSFVGVQARVVPYCGCRVPQSSRRSCASNPCLNDAPCKDTYNGYQCECPANNPEYFGPNCERVAASFNGQGWSWQPGIPACGNSHFSLLFKTQEEQGMLLYTGPSPYNYVDNVTDFMAVELVGGKPKMYINFGSGTKKLELEQRVDDGEDHYLVIRWTNDTVQMELDDKTCSNEISPSRNQCFLQITTHDSTHHFLNTNGPLHVGGVSFGKEMFEEVASNIGIHRDDLPMADGFAGCIRNLTFSAAGKLTLYDLGNPSDGENYTPGCDEEFVQAVVALGFNTNFLIAILICLLIIMIAVILLAVYRKRRHVFGDKDMDCDIRENIINYEDEGGGEGDQTGYDLSVLRMMSDGTPALHAMDNKKDFMNFEQEPPPDIQTFLQTNKDRIDGDPDATPYDDLRHYAYEGDGNSNGSLSSLNSSASDADLEFDYLHNFGPRFKKLADMYGEEPDSEDEDALPEDMRAPPPPVPAPHYAMMAGDAPPSESWC